MKHDNNINEIEKAVIGAIGEYLEIIAEKKVREADVTGGDKVPFGSSKHVRDLMTRIRGLESWRNKQKRGSEARANYSRLISRLKGELASAKRADAKSKLQEIREEQMLLEAGESKWWKDPSLTDPENPNSITFEEKCRRMAEEPEFKPFIDAIKNATDPKELAKAKRMLVKADDAGNPEIPAGFWMHFYKQKNEQLKDMRADMKSTSNQSQTNADARMDRLLRMRDSSGKATPRKF